MAQLNDIIKHIPKLAALPNFNGEIFMGNIISAENNSTENAPETSYEYRLSSSELAHSLFTGSSRSGKTVAALRFVSEAAKLRRKTGKKLRIIALDPKQEWRTLAKLVEPERFRFYSLGNTNLCPINLNICKVPKNVNPKTWIDGIIEIYCRNYGLMERGKSLLAETFYELYKEAGVFEDSPNWRDFVSERSKKVNLCAVYKRLLRQKLVLEGKVESDAYSRLIDRMSIFGNELSLESRLFGSSDGIGIDELINKDNVIVLESYGLESIFKNFIFGCITLGTFKYAQSLEGGFLNEDQYETILILEDANDVLFGSNRAEDELSEFDKMFAQAAGFGLYIASIAQDISDLPVSVVSNSGLVFAGKISRPEDAQISSRKLCNDEVIKWFPHSPIGWFICCSMNSKPTLVHIAPVSFCAPTDAELKSNL